MFFNNSKRKTFTEDNAPKKMPLKLSVEISLHVEAPYSSDAKDIVVLNHKEILDADSDSRIKEIKTEVENKLKELYDKTMVKIDLSDRLTDGFHAEKEREKESLAE